MAYSGNADLIFLIWSCFLLFLTICEAGISEHVKDKLLVQEFDVKPGGMIQEFEKTWKGTTCKFTYACQGGTKESWVLGMSISKDKTEMTCSIERTGGVSYLFFQQFQLEITGAKIQEVEVKSENEKDLLQSEYVFEKENNLVKHVDGEFQSRLAKIEVFAKRGKQEL